VLVLVPFEEHVRDAKAHARDGEFEEGAVERTAGTVGLEPQKILGGGGAAAAVDVRRQGLVGQEVLLSPVR
jgi:hypothetical protein